MKTLTQLYEAEEIPAKRKFFVSQRGVADFKKDLKMNGMKYEELKGNNFILDNSNPGKVNMAVKMVRERVGSQNIKEKFDF
ncbi:gp164 [Sphingomonas phage PAU]|uniref:gp164 n=1 Tax=Sphingomonas phage PAU TaxID=1150991 RepID=UPI00025732F0|nr:gp164 [Sphingomonas phage PAU]AFF28162.1 gp164 [Sphingomonas phage PAU]